MEPLKLELPERAQEQIRAIQAQMRLLETQLQAFVDGVIIGMGIDSRSNTIDIDTATMTATITSKEVGPQ